MRPAVVAFLCCGVLLLGKVARADPPSLQPGTQPLAVSTRTPSAFAKAPDGTLVVRELGVDGLIAVFMRIAAGDPASEPAEPERELEVDLGARLAELERRCEQQRALGKPCEGQAEINSLRAEITRRATEREVRRQQAERERAARLAAESARVEAELRRALTALSGNVPLTLRDGGQASKARRDELSSRIRQALARGSTAGAAPSKAAPSLQFRSPKGAK